MRINPKATPGNRLSAVVIVLATFWAGGAGTSAAPVPASGPADLGTLGGRQGNSIALCVNDAGQVGGVDDTIIQTVDGPSVNAHAMIWTSAGIQDIDPTGQLPSRVVSINKFGQVAGEVNFNDTPTAFFWSPQTGMILLGTLGGGYSQVAAINNNGAIAGTSQTATGQDHAFLWTKTGGMRDLETLGGTTSRARALNNNNVVVGLATTAQDGEQHAFAFAINQMHDLGTLGGGRTAEAKAVNDNGEVVGEAILSSGYTHGFYFRNKMVDIGSLFVDSNGASYSTAVGINNSGLVIGNGSSPVGGIHVITWSPETATLRDLGTLGGSDSQVAAVNDQGVVVGVSYLIGDQTTHAFRWTAAQGMQDLSLPGTASSAVALSPAGLIAGEYTQVGGNNHGFFWSPTLGFSDIPTAGQGYSSASALNSKGEVVGQSFNAAGYFRAFFWSSAGMKDLGPDGPTFSIAVAINNNSQVVVVASPLNPTPTSGGDISYLWSPQTNTLVNLGTLGGNFTTARAINNSGQVVGTSGTTSGQSHAFIWSAATGIMQDLDASNPNMTQAVTLNDDGLVTGWILQPSRLSVHAFAWKAGTNNNLPLDLGTLGGDSSQPTAVNSKGQIAGYSTTSTGIQHVFRWSSNKLQDLGIFPGGTGAQSAGMNSSGQVTGIAGLPQGVAQHAFLSTGSGLADLGTLNQGQNSEGVAVNTSGRVIGTSDFPLSSGGVGIHAFAATVRGGMVDLGTLGGASSQATGINDLNQICGSAENAGGETHAVLWTVP